VAAGYADGFSRRLSNRGHVLIGGKRCPIVGRVSMDQIIADATGARVQVADPAVLLGRQGNEELSVDEVAAAQDTISWEAFCAISARVPRRYREGDAGLIL
jgi:alanine racemase